MGRSALDEAMERYAGGDDDAFAAVYDGLAPRLYGYLRRQARDPALAEDLLQQTLLHIHRARGSFIPGAELLPWAFAIARRLFIDWQRRQGREILSDDGVDAEPASGPESRADNLVAARQLARDLEQALSRLPENQRVAFQLVRQEGLSVAEAAEVLGTTVGAVKVRAHRAYKALRTALGRRGEPR